MARSFDRRTTEMAAQRATSDGSRDLGPDELPSVIQAFEQALAALEMPLDEASAQTLRKEIAARIITAAEQGEHDPERLRAVGAAATSPTGDPRDGNGKLL
jgi:hypothetical protein